MKSGGPNFRLDRLDNPKTSSDGAARYLASGDKEEDLQHYKTLDRKLGVDLGILIPQGDFQKEFEMAPAIGLHFLWQAIEPWAFSVSTMRSSTNHKNGPALGKLTVNTISLGAQAAFAMGRTQPFIKMEGVFYFNDVSFDASRVVTSGNDTLLTTVGLSVGLGWDFIVGREIGFGIFANYNYAVPKKVTLANADQYDLGSSFATAGFRMNF